jgi:lipid-binding SYLF domain-containing protein
MTMRRHVRLAAIVIGAVMAAPIFLGGQALGVNQAGIDRDAAAALKVLYDTTPSAKMLAGKARAILVFPNIVKAGFVVGAQYGDGALIVKNKTTAYYNILAGSYGFQAGVQSFGYAMFLMTPAALDYLKKSGGWEVGVGPSVVLVDEGVARTMTTTTLKDDVYAFVFGQKGLMAGAGLQGSKITRIGP